MSSNYTGSIRDDDDTDGSVLTSQKAGKINARGNGANSHAVANSPNAPAAITGSTAPTAAADAFDAAAFDALPLPDKLDKAAHASLSFKMALIASTDVATASDARIRAALNAAQSIVLIKARIDEAKFHAPRPDRMEEHWARWEALKSRPIHASRAADGRPVSGLIEAQAVAQPEEA
jgi:hypothetical protein